MCEKIIKNDKYFTIDFMQIFWYTIVIQILDLIVFDSMAILRLGECFMLKKDVTITNSIGLHARPATFFIQKANSYKSSVWVEKDERKVNAKACLEYFLSGSPREWQFLS